MYALFRQIYGHSQLVRTVCTYYRLDRLKHVRLQLVFITLNCGVKRKETSVVEAPSWMSTTTTLMFPDIRRTSTLVWVSNATNLRRSAPLF